MVLGGVFLTCLSACFVKLLFRAQRITQKRWNRYRYAKLGVSLLIEESEFPYLVCWGCCFDIHRLWPWNQLCVLPYYPAWGIIPCSGSKKGTDNGSQGRQGIVWFDTVLYCSAGLCEYLWIALLALSVLAALLSLYLSAELICLWCAFPLDYRSLVFRYIFTVEKVLMFIIAQGIRQAPFH